MKRAFAGLLFLTLLLPVLLSAESSEESGGIYPSESQGEATNTIDVNRQALGTFESLPDDSSFTKDLRIASQVQNETRPHYYVLDGYVDISYKGMRLQADHAEYDTDTRDLIATGNVVLDQEEQRITGKRLELNLDTQKGTMYDTFGFFPPQFFFWGSKLDKLGEQTYRLHDGVITECSQIKPHWHLDSSTAIMTVDSYVRFKDFTLKAKSLPVFYSPYMMWPIKRERATGFLMPSFGPNNKKGFWIGGSFFWAMTRSMDSTYWVDHYSQRGWGSGAEYRYSSGEDSDGSVKYYFMNDRLLGRQYTIEGNGTQTLPADFRFAAVIDRFSSYQYIRDYANNLSRSTTQTQTAQAFLTRNWSYYSLNLQTDWAQKAGFSNRSNTSSYYHIPEVQFLVRDQQIGPTPFFWTLDSSYDWLGKGLGFGDTNLHYTFTRSDLFPSFYWPINYLSWITFTPTIGYRTTRYSSQANLDEESDDLVLKTPLTRSYTDFNLDIRGPNFGKIFDTPTMGYSQKWKHAIEPEVTYQYVSNIPELGSIIITDGNIDAIYGSSVITYSVTNYLYAKRPIKEQQKYKPDEYQYYNPKPLEEELTSPWEFLSWKLSQSYRFKSDTFDPVLDEAQSPYTDVRSDLRLNPTQSYSLEFDSAYNVQQRQLTSIQLTTNLQNEDTWWANVRYAYSNPVASRPLPGQPRRHAGNSLSFNGGVGMKNNRFVISGDMGYNITEREMLNSSLAFAFNEDCYSIGIQYKHFSNQVRVNGKENQITFSLSLPNIGNLVSFQNGQPPKRY